MIEAFRVGAVSRGKTLWEGLDLALGDGEIWVVAGPPSCGKTVLMNILRGERRAAERKRRTEELLSLLGLPGTEEAGVSSLSASERARAALAVELFRSPRYLFLDMLLANVGKEWEEKLGSLFRALAKEGRTNIMMERQQPERWQT